MIGIELEQAVELLSNKINLIEDYEEVELEQALGRNLVEDFYAPIYQPPFNRSPLDGIAVRAQDTVGANTDHPKTFKIIETVFAGMASQKRLGMGEAVRIMTGAPLPEGSDAVIRQEEVVFKGEEAMVQKSVSPYSNYCYKGEDIQKGQLLIEKCTTLTAIHLGVLASMGYNKVRVRRQLRVGLMSTGDELIKPGLPLEEGKIYNANTTLLAARLKELGMIPLILEAQQDDPDHVARKIKEMMPQLDILLTTGGVSVGQKDIMHEVILKLQATRLFWKVNMQPGTPILAMELGEQLILSLSGNPFAALATFECIARPVLGKMSGQSYVYPVKAEGVLKGAFNKVSKKRRMIRGLYEEGDVTIPYEHASGVLSSMIGCNCLIDIEADTPNILEGTKVKVIKL